MPLPTLKNAQLCMCCILLTSCVGASNWLSGSPPYHNSQFDPSQHFPSIRIGVSTQQEVINRLGDPTDRQIRSIEKFQHESFSYTTSESVVKPYQYLPFLGAVAFRRPATTQAPSAAISFSSENKVSGLTLSTVNAYGDIQTPEKFPISDSFTSFYGMRNPEVSQSLADPTIISP